MANRPSKNQKRTQWNRKCREKLAANIRKIHQHLQGHFVKSDVSFTARINELEKTEESLARELNEWKAQASLESEVRQKAEEEAARMKITVKEAQEDSRKLEGYIQKWKTEAKESSDDAVKCREVIGTIFALLKDFGSSIQ
ncbi:hypothetical protein PV05_06951 [Exophiala xenobiotica]|uniref:Uncharacterized protein n=1 Tax=Exophiala xenobiotica TaxID=348802 RepID=A0A0D2CWQ6_9EURO|nr:uncharacterized protein PV05_06951 [Exophiala xenobiotica]KIW54602.1 hypothetical protein PV05_06951 [Exophiala xenobiotica]